MKGRETDHVTRVRVGVVDHGVLERLEEVLLKLEVRELVLLQEAHRQLAKRVQREEADVRAVVAADLHKGTIVSFL